MFWRQISLPTLKSRTYRKAKTPNLTPFCFLHFLVFFVFSLFFLLHFFFFFSPKFLIRNLIVVVLRIIPYLNIQVGNQQVGRSNEVKFLAAKQFFSLLFFIILLVFLMCFFPYFKDFFHFSWFFFLFVVVLYIFFSMCFISLFFFLIFTMVITQVQLD